MAFSGMAGSASAANNSAKQPRLITVCVSTESSTLRTSQSNTCAYGAEYKLVWSPRSGAPKVCVNTRNREMTLAYANTCPFIGTRLAKARFNNEILACADKDTGLMRWPVTGNCWWENNPVTWFVAPTASSSLLAGSGGTAMAPGKGAVVVDGFVTDVKVAFGKDNSASINYLDDLIINVVANSPDEAGMAVIGSSSLRVYPNSALEISSRGYAPSTSVEVWMNSTPMKLASLTSDANGNVGGVVVVPGGVEIGNHTLTISGTLRNRKSSRASIGLEVITIQTTTGTSTAPSSKTPTTTTPTSSGSSTPASSSTTTSTSTTVPDTIPPTVTFARSASTSSSAPISFTVTGNEDINCTTLSLTAGTDFTLTNISTISSITQTSSDVCTIIAVSSASTNGVGVVSTLTRASTFSIDDTAGNSQTTLGGSPQSVTVTRNGEPNAPVISSATAGDVQVTVSWSAPTNNGSPISDYVIKHSTSSGGVYTTFVDGVSTATSATVTSLVNGTAYYFKVAAVNAVGTGSYSAASADATPLGAPAFTLSSSSESKAQNVAIAGYTITSTGGTVASYGISPSAPTGTSFSTSTGLLSGTPTTVQSATGYTITATNATGTATQTFTVTVTLAAPAFTLSSSSESKAQNTAITGYTISSTGGLIASYSISPSAPTGTSFNTSTGLLSGTPSTVQSATGYTITATNATSTASQTFTVTVTLAAPAFTLSSGSESKAQNTAITGYTITSTGGLIASYGISPSAPTGTSFNTSTGLLSGTPSTVQSATGYTITATNATSTASQTFTVTVTLAAPAFTLSSGSESKAQNTAIAGYTITSTGGLIASYSISPSAPTGTSFSTSTGLLSGTPSTVQSATGYTITATNATSTASQTFTLTVTAAPTTCASGGVCVVGDTGPGGGIVFYIQASSGTFTSTGSTCGTTCKYLEAAPAGWIVSSTPAGQTNCSTAGTSTVDPRCSWSGNTGTAVGTTAQGTAIGTGHGNTTAIIGQSSGGNTAGRAATAARAYQGGSKTDWFLPSKLELNQLCRYAWNLLVSPTNETCTGMGGSMRGGFSTGAYWSSSEAGVDVAWYQAFNFGNQNYPNKFSTSYVRPVRAFG